MNKQEKKKSSEVEIKREHSKSISNGRSGSTPPRSPEKTSTLVFILFIFGDSFYRSGHSFNQHVKKKKKSTNKRNDAVRYHCY